MILDVKTERGSGLEQQVCEERLQPVRKPADWIQAKHEHGGDADENNPDENQHDRGDELPE